MDTMLYELIQKTNLPYEIWRMIREYVVLDFLVAQDFLSKNLIFPTQVLYQDLVFFTSETFIHLPHSWEIDTYSQRSGTMIVYRWRNEIKKRIWSGDQIMNEVSPY